jgi:hypothetical protein
MLTAEKILKTEDISQPQKVHIPEWGGDVYVRVMTGVERDRWELSAQSSIDKPATANVRASLCAVTICDEKGKRLFTDNQAAALGAKSAVALNRVYEVSKRINRLTDEDIEELEKN